MKLQCMKCNEIIEDDANDIYSTKCGHIFHCQCLMHWLDRFQTCPHCSQSQMKDEPFRLYLTTSSTPEQDPVELKEELHRLRKDLKNKSFQGTRLNKKAKRLKYRNKKYREIVEKLKGEEEIINRTINFTRLAIRLDFQISKGKDLVMLQAKVSQLADRLRTLEELSKIVNAPEDEVDDILLESTLSEADLSKCADAFKRKLDVCNQRNEELDDDIMLSEMENNRLGNELNAVKREHSSLLQELCQHEDCSEQAGLRQKIFSLIQRNHLEDISCIFTDLEHYIQREQAKETVQEISTSPDTFQQTSLQPSQKTALQKRCKAVIKLAMNNPREYLNSGRVELYDSDEDSEPEAKKKTDVKLCSSSKFNEKKYKKIFKNKHLSADCGLVKKPKAQQIDMKDIDRSVVELMSNDRTL